MSGVQKILDGDKLQTGFRSKYNSSVDEIIVSVTVGPDGTITFRKFNNGTLTASLSTAFYSKSDIADFLSYKVDKVLGSSLMTEAEHSKLAVLSEHFKGYYASVSALESAHPTSEPGDYATVDITGTATLYIWDDEDGWVPSASGGMVLTVNGQTGAVTITAAGLGAELASNKVTSLVSPDDDTFPTTKAVKDYVNAADTELAQSIADLDSETITALSGKVDKIVGKGLSTEDFTSGEKLKLSNQSGTNTGDETKSSIETKLGFTSVDLANKVDKITGKGLSSQDYTLSEKTKLASLNQLFLGKYLTKGLLEAAHPTADPGQYAEVDSGVGFNVVKYLWDDEDGWVASGGVGGTLTDTDELAEGSTNKYFTEARSIGTLLGDLTGLIVNTAILATDSIKVALGKLQGQINQKQNKTDFSQDFYFLAISPDFGVITKDQNFKVDSKAEYSGTVAIKTSADVDYVLGTQVNAGDYLKIYGSVVGVRATLKGGLV